MRRRVTSAPVLADLLDILPLVAEQPVDEARLADTRRAEQSDCPAAREPSAQPVHALAGEVRDRDERDAQRHGLELEQLRRDVLVEIDLRHDDDGVGPALPGGRQVPLETPRVQVVAERGDDEDGVDVRRDDLLLRGPDAGARERRPARQNGVDRRAAVTVRRSERGPVTDRRQVGGGERLVPDPP